MFSCLQSIKVGSYVQVESFGELLDSIYRVEKLDGYKADLICVKTDRSYITVGTKYCTTQCCLKLVNKATDIIEMEIMLHNL